ncbi:phage head closure protein [Clostridium sp. D2Q-11]|uniref:Phage head closure protein n=1 Tax=Anaeromonas frigoriresistens TaxID=2683708 RepID=A0A942US31_9FIRM|nr:phage head closure protein [Anaeromonas frigoriresistens]MBS4538214.1 phage head closure protein [Anaeromonas frigoriresistens]
MWDEVIELGNYIETIVHGEVIQTLEWTTIFANKKSVRQSEFYEARNLGLKPELVFEVHSFEFNNNEKIRFPIGVNGKEYDIIRAYDKGEKTELTVTSFTGGEV